MTYWRIASATSSPRAIASISFSRWISCWTDGATAKRPMANIAMIAITAKSVMPRSPLLFRRSVIVIDVLFVGIWGAVRLRLLRVARDAWYAGALNAGNKLLEGAIRYVVRREAAWSS